MKPTKPKKPEREKPLETVGFRLDEKNAELLEARALSLGMGPHELARHVLLDGLQQQVHIGELSDMMLALREEVCELREDIALAVEVLLAHAGHWEENAALEWVDANFKPKKEL